MRLIAGVLRLDGGGTTAAALAAMAQAMTPAGLSPRCDYALDGPLGLCEVDFAAQPGGASVAPEGWLAAADLRLDRPEDFARAYPGNSDAARLIGLLERHGADFPDRLDGDFAVALWDKNRRHLWLGRDYIGVRPLAYTYQPGKWFAFASLPKGLHRTGLAARRPDVTALARLHLNPYFRGASSGFAEIRYLEAGHSLRVTADGQPPRSHRAYRPDPALVGTWRHGPDAAAEELRARVEAAVASRLPASGNIAADLSGGLDSSAITVIAARLMRQRGGRVLALSHFDDGPPDVPIASDRHLVEAVLRQERDLAWVPSQVDLAKRQFDEDLPQSVNSSRHPYHQRAAREFGAEIVLAGAGGDEGASFNGSGILNALLLRGELQRVWSEVALRAKIKNIPFWRTLAGTLLAPLQSTAAGSAVRRLRGRPPPAALRVPFLQPAFQKMVRSWRYPDAGPTARARVGLFTDSHLPGRCLAQALSAAQAGIAHSFPLLDRRVVDLSLSFPIDHFIQDGLSRQPFRRAMKGVLPEEVRLWPHKSAPMIGQIPRFGQRKREALALLPDLREDSLVCSVFDLDRIAAVLQQLPEGDAALALARNIASQGRFPRRVPREFDAALTAMTLAVHIARLNGSLPGGEELPDSCRAMAAQ